MGSRRLVAEGVQEHPGSQGQLSGWLVPTWSPCGDGLWVPWASARTHVGVPYHPERDGRPRSDCLVSDCGGFLDPLGETGSCWPGHLGSRALGTRGGFVPKHGKPAAAAICSLRPASPVPSLSAQT